MATAVTYTKTGNKASKATTLPKELFASDRISEELLHQVYTSMQANSRVGSAKTKDRSEVRGGGKKPWRQKGLGRARAGSSRSPIWRGGGVTFGPTGQQNHRKKLNRKTKRSALRQALTLKAQEKQVLIIEEMALDGKTKTLVDLMKKLSLQRRVLFIVDESTKEMQRSTSNLPNVEILTAKRLNTVQVLDADWLVVTKAGLKQLQEHLEVTS